MNNNSGSSELYSMEMPPTNFPTIKSPIGPGPVKLSFTKSLNNVSIKLYKNKNYMNDDNLTKFEKNQLSKSLTIKP